MKVREEFRFKTLLFIIQQIQIKKLESLQFSKHDEKYDFKELYFIA